jgi:hypothetical protein
MDKNCFNCKFAIPLYIKQDTFIEVSSDEGCYCTYNRRSLDGKLGSHIQDSFSMEENCIFWEE